MGWVSELSQNITASSQPASQAAGVAGSQTAAEGGLHPLRPVGCRAPGSKLLEGCINFALGEHLSLSFSSVHLLVFQLNFSVEIMLQRSILAKIITGFSFHKMITEKYPAVIPSSFSGKLN